MKSICRRIFASAAVKARRRYLRRGDVYAMLYKKSLGGARHACQKVLSVEVDRVGLHRAGVPFHPSGVYPSSAHPRHFQERTCARLPSLASRFGKKAAE